MKAFCPGEWVARVETFEGGDLPGPSGHPEGPPGLFPKAGHPGTRGILWLVSMGCMWKAGLPQACGLRGQQLRAPWPPRQARHVAQSPCGPGHLGDCSLAPCTRRHCQWDHRLLSNAAPKSGGRPGVAAGTVVVRGPVLQERLLCVWACVVFIGAPQASSFVSKGGEEPARDGDA